MASIRTFFSPSDLEERKERNANIGEIVRHWEGDVADLSHIASINSKLLDRAFEASRVSRKGNQYLMFPCQIEELLFAAYHVQSNDQRFQR